MLNLLTEDDLNSSLQLSENPPAGMKMKINEKFSGVGIVSWQILRWSVRRSGTVDWLCLRRVVGVSFPLIKADGWNWRTRLFC